MEAGAKGCEVIVTGKLRAARAKAMKFKDGYMISSGQPTEEFIDSAVRHVLLRQGCLGIKVRRRQLFVVLSGISSPPLLVLDTSSSSAAPHACYVSLHFRSCSCPDTPCQTDPGRSTPHSPDAHHPPAPYRTARAYSARALLCCNACSWNLYTCFPPKTPASYSEPACMTDYAGSCMVCHASMFRADAQADFDEAKGHDVVPMDSSSSSSTVTRRWILAIPDDTLRFKGSILPEQQAKHLYGACRSRS